MRGALIILGFFVVSMLIFFAGDLFRKLQPSVQVVALVDYAGTLDKNSIVWIAGREVGVVTSVVVMPPAADSIEPFAVNMRVPRKYLTFIRRDSQARITTARIIGNQVVDILPGSAQSPVYREGDTLRIRPSGTMEGVLERTLVLTAAMDSMVLEMKVLEAPATRGGEHLVRINENVQAVSKEFKSLMTAFEEGPLQTLSDPRMQDMLGRLSTRSRELSAAFGRAAERARAAKSDAQPSLERLMAHADTISMELARLQESMKSGGGLMARAQTDTAIVKAIHRAQEQIDSLMAETKRNPLRFWF
jgi:ABC-type transporter Mla subunit MlaD